MRILMLSPPGDVRGPLPKLTPHLIAGLRGLGADVTAASWGGQREDESIVTKTVGRLRDIGRVRRLLARQAFDVMVIATAHDWFTLARDIGLLLVTRGLGARAVVQFHGSQSGQLNRPGRRLFKLVSAWLMRLSAGALVLSSEEQREWQAFGKSRKIYVVSNPFVAPRVSEEDEAAWTDAPPPHPPLVLFVARLIPEKGIHVVLHAFARLLRTTPAHLLVVGDGPEKDAAHALAATLGIDKATTFTGYLRGRELASAYRSGTVLVLPTTWSEGFPTVITEAMSAGLPIVTTRRRGMADHLRDGINALFVPPEDPDALAAAVERLLADPALRERMERANRQKVEEFRPRAVAEQYLEVLRDILKDGGAPSPPFVPPRRIAWRVRRVRAMSAAEIWHRLHITVRDRWRPPPYAADAPEEASRRLFAAAPRDALASSRLHRLVAAPGHRELFEVELTEARALLAGRWNLFGRDVKLDDPPRWHRNAITGQDWPDARSRQLDYRNPGVAGGPRYTWELGRLTMLPTLALAARQTGDDLFVDRTVAWLNDWTARNRLGNGIHHTSTLEMAIRVVEVCWALALLGDRARRVPVACLGLLAQQALYCRDHLSLGSSANNHLIAEYAAMVMMGAMFPALRSADELLETGVAGLEVQVPRQFHPDGVNAEQAFGYLPFVWELLLSALIAAEAAGRVVTAVTRERLHASLEFARTVRLPGGRWPQVGDEDDSRLLLVAEGRSRLDLVGNALAAWLGADGLSDRDTALAALVFGRIPPPRAAAEGMHRFASGGYTVWRSGTTVVTFDHGPLGLGPLAAHGHADALSLTVFHGRDAVVIDPGTFAYHEDLAARDRWRSTPYHSTIHFGGHSQSEMLGPFLWGRRAHVTPRGAGFVCRWATGEIHERTVSVTGDNRIDVTDVAHGPEPHVVFVLPPGAALAIDGTRAIVEAGATRASFEADGIAGWRAEPGEYAPRLGISVPVVRLVAPVSGGPCRTTIALAPR